MKDDIHNTKRRNFDRPKARHAEAEPENLRKAFACFGSALFFLCDRMDAAQAGNRYKNAHDLQGSASGDFYTDTDEPQQKVCAATD